MTDCFYFAYSRNDKSIKNRVNLYGEHFPLGFMCWPITGLIGISRMSNDDIMRICKLGHRYIVYNYMGNCGTIYSMVPLPLRLHLVTHGWMTPVLRYEWSQCPSILVAYAELAQSADTKFGGVYDYF